METRKVPGWDLLYFHGGRVRHLIPVDDSFWHNESPDCDCEPVLEWLLAEGNVRWGRFYIHSAHDGRD